MKKYTIVLILACGYFLSSHAQQSCKDCIYDLYKVLGTCQSKCIDIGNNTYSVKSLYQDKSDSIIFAAITKAHVFSYGNPLDSVVELDLGDKALYFMVTTEPPRSFRYSDINCVYDSKGCNLLYKEDYMKFPAVINDPDGFTYVRERPSTKSKVKITRYFYIPQFGEVIGAGLILTMGVYLLDIYIVNEYYHLINALWILKRK